MGLINKFLRRFSRYIEILLKPAYRVYELWLWSQISEGPIPRHVAIIPDGNRRWARELGKSITYGHEVGYERLKEILSWLWELNVKVVTIYTMSHENCLRRSAEERQHLFNLLRQAINELRERGDIHERKIRVRFFGRLDLIPKDLIESIKEVEHMTKSYSDRFLNIALCYGGRQEIVDAVKEVVTDVIRGKLNINDIDEHIFRKYLYTAHLDEALDEPDLVIRTSGELRLSNFLLWQIAYSELYFCDVFWPEFRKIDLWRAIRSFQRRERRFGG